LVAAFDAWFDEFPHLPVRTFDQILGMVAGLPSSTDAFGLGDVSLLSIETDGSYHDLDVLKITEEGGTAIGESLESAPIAAAADSDRIADHRRLLTLDGLAPECAQCPEVKICGGGAVPHRFDHDGFDHPTVYCAEMLTLIAHVRNRLISELRDPTAGRALDRHTFPAGFSRAEPGSGPVRELLAAWEGDAIAEWETEFPGAFTAVAADALGQAVTHPAIVLRSRVTRDARRGVMTSSLGGRSIAPDPDATGAVLAEVGHCRPWSIHRDEPWLRAPFDPPIVFETDPATVEAARRVTSDALALIGTYSPPLLSEMTLLCREVQFIRDLDAEPDKCVSFSDDILPGAVFVSVAGRDPGTMIDAVDLADSLIHECRHQKLYLLQRTHQLFERDYPLVSSPWRQDLRPPSGLLHALFVFVELYDFWAFMSTYQPGERADAEMELTARRLHDGFAVLDTTALTPTGQQLMNELRERSPQ
jgi:uncharacterized protein